MLIFLLVNHKNKPRVSLTENIPRKVVLFDGELPSLYLEKTLRGAWIVANSSHPGRFLHQIISSNHS